ncbi:MAG: gas vesicle protein GvpD P-loop domain-containing protein, partial [Candidatus Helarchaeota archaeon]
NVDLMMPSPNTIRNIKNKFKFANTPEFFVKIFEYTEDLENCTIVIDSWNAVTETISFNEQYNQNKIEPILTELVRQHNFKLILVLENDEHSYLDYLVDGVLILNNTRYNNRRIRTVEIQKIRGVKNIQPEYLFTLNETEFRYFPPYKFNFPEILIRPDPIPDPRKNTISTGMTDFDELTGGGFEKGSWNMLEIAHGIGEEFYSIITPIIVNHLNLDRGLVAILPEGVSPIIFNQYLEGFVGKDRLKKLVSAINIGLQKDLLFGNINEVNPDEFFDIVNKQISKFNEKFGYPVLTFLGLGSLQHIFDERKLVSSIAKQIASTRIKDNITIILIQEQQKMINALSHMVSTHWKLDLIDKALVLYGIRPETEINSVITNASEGYIHTNLIPIF